MWRCLLSGYAQQGGTQAGELPKTFKLDEKKIHVPDILHVRG